MAASIRILSNPSLTFEIRSPIVKTTTIFCFESIAVILKHTVVSVQPTFFCGFPLCRKTYLSSTASIAFATRPSYWIQLLTVCVAGSIIVQIPTLHS